MGEFIAWNGLISSHYFQSNANKKDSDETIMKLGPLKILDIYLHQRRLYNHCGLRVCLSVCLFVSEQHNPKSYAWIFFKFSESVHICLSRK